MVVTFFHLLFYSWTSVPSISLFTMNAMNLSVNESSFAFFFSDLFLFYLAHPCRPFQDVFYDNG